MRNADMEARWARRLNNAAELLDSLLDGRGAKGIKGGVVTEVRLRLPTPDRVETLLVVKASDGVDGYIAFVGALNPVDALLTWRAKDGAGGLKWREDVPWTQR